MLILLMNRGEKRKLSIDMTASLNGSTASNPCTLVPTGAIPRTRVPVTTISSMTPVSSRTAEGAAAVGPADCAAAACASASVNADAQQPTHRDVPIESLQTTSVSVMVT